MTVLDSLTEDCRQAGVAPELLDMAGFVLASLYEGISVGQMKSDCRVHARIGHAWADENKVFTAMKELERVGLVKDGKVVERVKEVRKLQGSLFE